MGGSQVGSLEDRFGYHPQYFQYNLTTNTASDEHIEPYINGCKERTPEIILTFFLSENDFFIANLERKLSNERFFTKHSDANYLITLNERIWQGISPTEVLPS